MPTVIINWVAVVVAAVANMIIGSLWYSNLLFGKVWQRKVGLKDSDMRKNRTTAMLGAALLALLTSYILAHFVAYTQSTTVWEGAAAGFWLWLGFVFTTLLMQVLFVGRGKKLFLINAGNMLVSLVVMGAILAAWA